MKRLTLLLLSLLLCLACFAGCESKKNTDDDDEDEEEESSVVSGSDSDVSSRGGKYGFDSAEAVAEAAMTAVCVTFNADDFFAAAIDCNPDLITYSSLTGSALEELEDKVDQKREDMEDQLEEIKQEAEAEDGGYSVTIDGVELTETILPDNEEFEEILGDFKEALFGEMGIDDKIEAFASVSVTATMYVEGEDPDTATMNVPAVKIAGKWYTTT